MTFVLLDIIAKNELFSLPTTLVHTPDMDMGMAPSYGGLRLCLARRVKRDQSVEVFRWLGESTPVENIYGVLHNLRLYRRFDLPPEAGKRSKG